MSHITYVLDKTDLDIIASLTPAEVVSKLEQTKEELERSKTTLTKLHVEFELLEPEVTDAQGGHQLALDRRAQTFGVAPFEDEERRLNRLPEAGLALLEISKSRLTTEIRTLMDNIRKLELWVDQLEKRKAESST